MREHYDFSKMKGQKNPYTKQLKQPVTMRLDKPRLHTSSHWPRSSACPTRA